MKKTFGRRGVSITINVMFAMQFGFFVFNERMPWFDLIF